VFRYGNARGGGRFLSSGVSFSAPGNAGYKNSGAACADRGKNELQVNVATRKENKVNEKRLC
jgi:hypothetical protein